MASHRWSTQGGGRSTATPRHPAAQRAPARCGAPRQSARTKTAARMSMRHARLMSANTGLLARACPAQARACARLAQVVWVSAIMDAVIVVTRPAYRYIVMGETQRPWCSVRMLAIPQVTSARSAAGRLVLCWERGASVKRTPAPQQSFIQHIDPAPRLARHRLRARSPQKVLDGLASATLAGETLRLASAIHHLEVRRALATPTGSTE